MRAIDYFDKGAEANLDRTAVITADTDASWSYREMRTATQNIARALCASGLRDQEPAGIYSHNDARVLFCMLGIMRAGAVWVPINYRNAIDANVEYMKYVEIAWLFYHSQFRDSVDEIKQRVPSLRGIICLDREDGEHPSLQAFMQRFVSAEVPDWGDAYGNIDRLAGLVPTGGTSGPAKGVRVTNLSLGTMTEMAAHYWRGDVEHPICLNTAPLSHAAGVLAFMMCSVGATNVVMSKFDALEALRNIERYRVTHLYLPPTALYNLLAHPEVRDFDYSSLRGFLLAGSPVAPEKLRSAVEIFGPCMCQSYGQTEAPMIMTFLDCKTVAAAAAGVRPERLASCGKPTLAVRLAIMDDNGRILPAGERGEIVVRGSLVGGGYYKMPEATAEIRTRGWHHTGDVGYMDEEGYVYIVDRKKDMIISGGFNVYCAEVEAAVMALPEVYECAVVGIPHEKWGEAVTAFVVLRPGISLSEADIISHCKNKLGGVKTPKSVEFCDEIPKTAAGKIDRKKIRAPYWRHAERQVH
ncbi:MAG TPA: AMP-binding protein [Terriglobales bacterium]|nr:AMP-binding protein [Terriglobales bacterium]